MSPPIRSIQTRARFARVWSTGLYVAGVAALGAGLLVGGIVALATGSAGGLSVAAVIAAAGVATGGLGLWESRRFSERAKRLEQTASEQRLFALAVQHGGTLRVVDVARGMHMMTAEAEALLDGLVDEVRVSMLVSEEGEIRYVFRELDERVGPRVRVAVAESEAIEETAPDATATKEQTSD
jgi:hypothetical protein